eukprot:3219695-Ditylum_brightwellii.AAC.1
MKQVAFERGYIDLDNVNLCLKEGPKGEDDRRPKCHPELQGEGIEYTWVIAKIRLRGVALEKRTNKGNLMTQ